MLKSIKVLAASVFMALFVLLPAAAYAVDITSEACQGIDSAICKDAETGKTNNPLFGENGALTKAISILSIVIGIIAVIILIVSGIRFAVSQGDPGSINKVRNTIIYAFVGLGVAVLAQAIVNFVLNKL